MTQYALIFLLYLRELMRQFNGPDLEFMGQFLLFIDGSINEDTQFKKI